MYRNSKNVLSVKIRVYAKFTELYITSVHSYNRGRYFPNLLGKTRMKIFIYLLFTNLFITEGAQYDGRPR